MDLEIVWSLSRFQRLGAPWCSPNWGQGRTTICLGDLRADSGYPEGHAGLLVYWQSLITRRSLSFVTLGPSAQQHFDVKSLSIVVVGRWDMSGKNKSHYYHKSLILNCNVRREIITFFPNFLSNRIQPSWSRRVWTHFKAKRTACRVAGCINVW